MAALAEMADQVAKSGVKQIDGDVIGDDTWFPAERYGRDGAGRSDGSMARPFGADGERQCGFFEADPGAQPGER